jgi:hypothetical protein
MVRSAATLIRTSKPATYASPFYFENYFENHFHSEPQYTFKETGRQ